MTKTKSRFSSELNSLNSNENMSQHSLLWHLALHNSFSIQDCKFLQSVTPKQCSLFILIDNNIVFKSDTFDETIQSVTTEINHSYDATYVQKLESSDNGALRVLTIPFDKNILVGLISSIDIKSVLNIEDVFLHKVHIAQRKYFEILQIVTEMQNTLDHTEPLLVINRSDNQILTCNDLFLSFFNLTKQEILESNLKELQKKYPKTSNRKVVLKNCVIGATNCSIVQYTLKPTEIIQSEILTDELKSHTENLLQFYYEIQSNKNINNTVIDNRIEEIQKSYQSILKLHNK